MTDGPRGADAATAETSHARALDQAYRLCVAGRLAEAAAVYERILADAPDDVAALANLGAVRGQTGDLKAAVRCLSRALALAPGDDNVRRNLFAAHCHAYDRAMSADDLNGAIEATRALRALNPDQPATRINLTDHLSAQMAPARLEDFAPDLDPATLGTKILVACMPKSGSSWLSAALQRVTGFQRAHFAYAYLQNEQELHLPFVVATARSDTITQQHCRATAANLHIMQGFGIRPIVLVRNLFDALISLVDFYDAGAVHNTFFDGDYQRLERDARIDLVIECVAPWYVQFFVSWVRAERDGQARPLWIAYKDMVHDNAGTLKAALAFCGLRRSDAEIAAAIAAVEGDRATTRFNKGRIGRGAEEMSAAQMDRVRGLTRFFPSIDFAPIGLEP